MGNVGSVTLDFSGKVPLMEEGKYRGGGLGIISGTAKMAASYATNGDTWDLSSYFADVPYRVLITHPSGLQLSYVKGTTAANGKVKAQKSTKAHTHTAGAITVDSHTHTGPSHTHANTPLTVTGGAAAAGTKALYLNGTTALQKEEAGNTTLDTGTTAAGGTGATGGTVATASGAATGSTGNNESEEVAAAQDLSTTAFEFIAFGPLK